MGQARGAYGRRDEESLRLARRARVVARLRRRDEDYRRTLGVAEGQPLPAVIGAVGLGRMRWRG